MSDMVTNVQEVSQEIIDLVIERLSTIPPNVSISVGDKGTFSIEEMINNVRERNELGNKIVEIQLEYLKSLKNFASDATFSLNN